MTPKPRKNAAQYVELTCAHTGETFKKKKKDYDKACRRGQTRFYKDARTAGIAIGNDREKKAMKAVTRFCLWCAAPFSVVPTSRSSLYCSYSCSNKHRWSNIKKNKAKCEEIAQKCSDASKRSWNDPRSRQLRAKTETRICPVCDTPFDVLKRSTKRLCKRECRIEWFSQKARANPNCGGETNYRRYKYNNITMDSQWEVDIAVWMDEHGIKWNRSRKMMFHWTDQTGSKRRYYPDFYLPDYDLYLDPKNKYLIEKDRFKIEAVQRETGIKIVWGLKETIIEHLQSLLSFQPAMAPV